MKVVIVSKAFVNEMYRKKLVELAALGVEVIAMTPTEWREGGSTQRLEHGMHQNHELVVLPMRWNGHFHVHYYPQLPTLLRHTMPDLVHIDEEPYNLAAFLGVLAARRLGIPSVFFTWQNLLREYPFPFRDMERAVYRWVSGALAGSDEARAVLRHKGYRGQSWVVPQFGVDPEAFSPSVHAERPFTVGLLSRLVPGKAPLLALSAFSGLPIDARLLIVGEGLLRDEVSAEIARLGLSNRVEMRSRVPSVAMPDIIRNVDVVVLPSISTPTWKEQFGRVLIESMACAVPVIGSDSGEIPHVIGNAGMVIPEGDELALSQALHKLYDNADLRRELGARGRDRVLQHYTHRRIAEATLSAYSDILDMRWRS